MEKRTDRQLIDAIAARDETACYELYEIYGAELRRYLVRTVRDAASADDLLQELLLRAWNRSARGNGLAALRAAFAARVGRW